MYMLTDRERYMLRRARDLADEVERLKENLRELDLLTISSPNMDGMPHGSSAGDAMDRRVIRREKIETRLRSAERALNRARTVGGKALRNVKASMRMFCEAYFIECASLEEACRYARVDERTGERYCAVVNKDE